MLISQNLLTAYLRRDNPGWSVTPEELDAGFVRVGFETEGYAPIPESTGPLVIGRVLGIEELTGFKKPIRYCQVDVGRANGTGEPQGIVCGARNFAEGDSVVVALPGTVLPGNFSIAARKTYGHISAGMMCSATELGLTDKPSAGIITLGDDAPAPGQDAREALGLRDTIFDVNVTPDRGYALSLRGLAREIASAFGLSFRDPAAGRLARPASGGLAVSLDPATKAQRFGVRSVRGIDPRARSPFWLQRELMNFGSRPVNVATDVTNYVMFTLGAPMHAFDAAAISGGLTVRLAREGERLETLDHVDRELSAEDVVICDEADIQSLAGVMGGSTSEISETTTDVHFEAAIWDPLTVARTSRRHRLSSESSRRFERGVDPALVEVALDRATSLLAEIAGGTVDDAATIVGDLRRQGPAIRFDPQLTSRLAGVELSSEEVCRRLREIGCRVEERQGEEALSVTPPTWRTDLAIPEDLVEDVLRLGGLADIPPVLPTPRGGRGLSPAQRRRRAIGHALAYGGYAEVLPTPFIASDTFDRWGLADDDPRRRAVRVRNPLESSDSLIATTLLPSMLQAMHRNLARGQRNLSLFGLQQVAFAGADVSPMPSVTRRPSGEELRALQDSLPEQPLHVATVAVGEVLCSGPGRAGASYEWADAIEAARLVARTAGVEVDVVKGEEEPWHPGRCAALRAGGRTVGWAGELHPTLLQELDLPSRVCAMELDVSALPCAGELPAPRLSVFPAVRQDIALVVSEDTPAEEVRRALREGAGDLVDTVTLFDVFRSDKLGAGRKSLAFSLTFRAPDRTLTEDEASAARLQGAERARERFGAEMRGA